MFSCIYLALLPLLSSLEIVCATRIVARVSRNESCNSATSNDTCEIRCDTVGSVSSGSESVALDCGFAGHCIIDCASRACLAYGVLNAANVNSTLTVISSAESCLYNTSVVTPNTGNASFSMTAAYSFQHMVLQCGTSAQRIVVDCTLGLGGECDNMFINASSAEYLEVIIGKGSTYNGRSPSEPAAIHCPGMSNLYSSVARTPCLIDVSSGGALAAVNISADEGVPRNVWIETGTDSVVDEVNVICKYGVVSNSGNTFPTTSVCWSDGTSPSPAPSQGGPAPEMVATIGSTEDALLVTPKPSMRSVTSYVTNYVTEDMDDVSDDDSFLEGEELDYFIQGMLALLVLILFCLSIILCVMAIRRYRNMTKRRAMYAGKPKSHVVRADPKSPGVWDSKREVVQYPDSVISPKSVRSQHVDQEKHGGVRKDIFLDAKDEPDVELSGLTQMESVSDFTINADH